MSVSDMLPHPKSIRAPAPFKKSMPKSPAASEGNEHTKNLCVISRPFTTKETVCWPLMSRTSPVTSYGRMRVTCTGLLDMPGYNMETLDPVSRIRCRVTLSISTEIEGVPCSNETELKVAMTAFSGMLRWRELSSLTPRSCFPDCSFLSDSFALVRTGVCRRSNLSASNAQLGSFFLALERSSPLFSAL